MSKYNKFFAAAAGVLGQVVAANVVTGAALHYVQVVLAALTALSVLAVPNVVAGPVPSIGTTAPPPVAPPAP